MSYTVQMVEVCTHLVVVYWTSVTSRSIFESGGDHLTAEQVTPVPTNVAMPCCLLRMEPARKNPGSFRLSFAVLCVSCSSTTATWLQSSSCRMISPPEEDASLCLGQKVR